MKLKVEFPEAMIDRSIDRSIERERESEREKGGHCPNTEIISIGICIIL